MKALLATIGSAIILYDENLTIGFWKGILLIQASNILFAVGQVYYKSIFRKDGITNHASHFAILFAGGALITGIFSVGLVKINEIDIGLNQWLVILYLGVVASGIGFFLWNYGITKVSIGQVAIFNNLKIPLGVFFAMLILGESVNSLQLIIGSLILLIAFYAEKMKWRFLHL
jgi:drug/metabolite transporter (DMT)-like permease